MLVPSPPRGRYQDRVKHARILLGGSCEKKEKWGRSWRKLGGSSDCDASVILEWRRDERKVHTIHPAEAWGKFRDAIRDMTSQSWRSEECPVSQQQHALVSLLHSLIGWEHWGRRGLAATMWSPEAAAPLGAGELLSSLEVGAWEAPSLGCHVAVQRQVEMTSSQQGEEKLPKVCLTQKVGNIFFFN